MALTYSDFVDTLGALSVAGVTAKTEPPQRINRTDLPIGYPRMPSGNQGVVAFSGGEGIDAVACEYVILIDPVPADGYSTNYDATATAMDSLNAALKTEAAASNEIDRWEMRMDIEDIGGTAYWAVIATIEASG